MASIGGAGWRRERFGDEGEVASVGRVDVDAEAVAVAEREDLVERIDGADGGGAEGDDDGADSPLRSSSSRASRSMRPRVVGGDGGERRAEDGGDAVVGVVGLLGGDDALAGASWPATQRASRLAKVPPR